METYTIYFKNGESIQIQAEYYRHFDESTIVFVRNQKGIAFFYKGSIAGVVRGKA